MNEALLSGKKIKRNKMHIFDKIGIRFSYNNCVIFFTPNLSGWITVEFPDCVIRFNSVLDPGLHAAGQ